MAPLLGAPQRPADDESASASDANGPVEFEIIDEEDFSIKSVEDLMHRLADVVLMLFLVLKAFFFKRLFWDIVEYVKPFYINLKNSGPRIASTMNFFESVWNETLNILKKLWAARDLKMDLIALLITGKDLALEFLASGGHLRIMYQLWYLGHMRLRESVKELENISYFLVPPIEGQKPLYDFNYKEEKNTLRQVSFYVIANTSYRLYLQTKELFSRTMRYFDPSNETTMQEIDTKLVSRIEEVPSSDETKTSQISKETDEHGETSEEERTLEEPPQPVDETRPASGGGDEKSVGES